MNYFNLFEYSYGFEKERNGIGLSMRTYKPNRHSGPDELLFETLVRNWKNRKNRRPPATIKSVRTKSTTRLSKKLRIRRLKYRNDG
jgi:hypothetical protein